MGTTTAEVTVTPVFWQPSGGRYVFPPGYESIIDRFVANVAAASGTNSNVFSIATEYYQNIGGTKTSISDAIRAGTPIADTDAFPSNGCTPAKGYPVCITDSQLRTDPRRSRAAIGWRPIWRIFIRCFSARGRDQGQHR